MSLKLNSRHSARDQQPPIGKPLRDAKLRPQLRNGRFISAIDNQTNLANLGLSVLIVLGSALLLSLLCVSVAVAWIVRDVPTPDQIRRDLILASQANTSFYFAPEDNTMDLGYGKRIITFDPRPMYDVYACNVHQGLDETAAPVPSHFLKLLLASEDNDFCTHSGFDVRGIARVLNDRVRALLGKGRPSQAGASTITQQLAKNASCYIDNGRGAAFIGSCDDKREIDRKIREVWVAMRIEQEFNKAEILALYLNAVKFWGGHQGLAIASQRFFRTTPERLTLAQSALLVGILKASSAYNPVRNWDSAFAQAGDVVLGGAYNKNFNSDKTDDHLAISAEQRDQALQELARPYRANLFDEAPWFSENNLVNWLKRTRQITTPAQGNSVRWVTTLDADMQEATEQVAKEFFDGTEYAQAPAESLGADAMAIVILDRSGAIRAMLGGQKVISDRADRATKRRRPPGSTIKPLIYALAIEAGCSVNSTVEDRALIRPGDPVDASGRWWNPSNASGTYAGSLTLSQALATSNNTIPVQLANKIPYSGKIGLDALDFALASDLGISIRDRRDGAVQRRLQNALGTREMTPLEVGAMFLPYLNEGRVVRPRGLEASITTNANNRLSRQQIPARTAPFLSPATANSMVYMLHNVVNGPGGTGFRAQIDGLDIIGKTGTTDASRDAWFVGATNDLVAVVWIGRDDGRPLERGVSGGTAAVSVWRNVVSSVYFGQNARPLPQPFALLPAVEPADTNCLGVLTGQAGLAKK